MILENRTRYCTADLERIILAGLAEFDVKHGRDQVHVVYGRAFSGFCYFPWASPLPKGTRTRKHTGARMVLRVPRPKEGVTFDVALFAWLVRHEVGHWRGLRHVQMHPMMRHRAIWEKDRSLAPWAIGMTVGVEESEPKRPRKPKKDADAVRVERLEHARRIASAERALQNAAAKA